MADQTPHDPQDEQTPTQPEGSADETPTPEATPSPSPEEAAAASAVPQPEAEADDVEELDEQEAPTPRVKPAIPGADLEVDIVLDGEDRPSWSEDLDPDAEEAPEAAEEQDVVE